MSTDEQTHGDCGLATLGTSRIWQVHEGFSGCSRWPLLLAQGRFHPWKEALAFETCNVLSSTRRASCAEELKLGERRAHGLPFSCTEMFNPLDAELVQLLCKLLCVQGWACSKHAP